MTKQERKFLRAAYHHFDAKQIRHTNTPDYGELAAMWRQHKTLMKILFELLCLEGDIDGVSIENLEEIFEENKIEFINSSNKQT
jgi:hypothetical protein